jgi:hypothetical protein
MPVELPTFVSNEAPVTQDARARSLGFPEERRMKATVGVVIALLVAGLTAAGCGGSKSKHGTSTTSTSHTSGTASAATATAPTVTSGPVHASLRGANHTPTPGKRWVYTVRVTAASGKPLAGKVQTEYAFAGTVVGRESPPIHPLKAGVLHDTVTFPPSAIGHPITLVTVIRTSAGSVALGWPVTVSK